MNRFDEQSSQDGQRSGRDIITVEDLTVGYGSATVLDKVSFSVREGEIFAILGPSGCGKSTLFNALIGLLRPRQGRIRIGGETLGPQSDEQSLARVRRQIGVLFQSGALLDWLTVGENVAFRLREATGLPEGLIEQIVRLKLELVKLDTNLHSMPAELSGGMVRRAGLAASMATDPALLFCDEPTSGLDPTTAMDIDELLLEVNRFLNITILVVTHEVMTLENIASSCIMLDKEAKGIIASGSLKDLQHNSDDPRVQAFFQRRIETDGTPTGSWRE
jgi:phospholipid/cholesterol/gamma-HCH transport system ATP-binding protein